MKKTLVKLDYTPYTYDDTDMHTVRISDTAKSLVFVGNKQGVDNKIKEQLVEINNVGQNVEELGPYCCYDCSSLTAVNAPNVKKYGSYSFTNANISSMHPFENGSVVFSIGDHAFENTQLTSVNLALSGRNILDPADPENGYQGCKLRDYETGPYVGNYAFKDCKKLKSVTIAEHPELATGMFEGCTSLTSVSITKNYGACVGDYTFKNCTALPSITFPENWEIVSQYMFDSCAELTAVNFSDSANAKLFTVENNAFNNCPKLKDITLPKSINNLNGISENAFAGSSLSSITFSGVADSIFDAFKSQDAKWTIVPEDYNTTNNFKYGVWYLNSCTQIVPYAINNHIPLIMKLCSPGCGFCTSFNTTTFNTKEFQTECAKRPYLFIECLYGLADSVSYKLTDSEKNYLYYLLNTNNENKIKKMYDLNWDIPWDRSERTFVIFAALWYKPDGSWVAKQWRTSGTRTKENQTSELFEKIDKYFAGYEREEKYNGPGYVLAQYVSFNGWGLDHNCQLNSAEGTQYTFDFASKTIVKGNLPISQIQEERAQKFAVSTPDRTRVITVALDYVGTSQSALRGMTQDADDIERILTPYSNHITKLTNSQAKYSAVKDAIVEAVEDENCDLLIFHFSGHGGSGENGKSHMCMYDTSFQDSTFWKLIEHAKCRILCIFACCHAGTMFKATAIDDSNEKINFQEAPDFSKSAERYFNGDDSVGICAASDTPNLLVWSACTDGEVSWMYSTTDVQNGLADRTGHCMINHMLKGFNLDLTYKQLWEKVPAEEQMFNEFGKPYIYKNKEVFVHPQLSELGQSFQNFKVFT